MVNHVQPSFVWPDRLTLMSISRSPINSIHDYPYNLTPSLFYQANNGGTQTLFRDFVKLWNFPKLFSSS